MLSHTHDGALRCWVESANDPGTDFPIQNLPFGSFRPRGDDGPWRIGVAIGTSVFDLAGAARHDLVSGPLGQACAQPRLNHLMSLGDAAARALRELVSRLLRADTDEGARARQVGNSLLFSQDDVDLAVPCDVGDYTDFYASIHHARNVGSMFRPDAPLLPNYKWVPIGYHGRASSIVVSGTPVRRPIGQQSTAAPGAPIVAPSSRLDYEAEVGFFIGEGNALGVPIAIGQAAHHLFGACLLNDWSARDIQAWEYQPLGPFLAKSFATTVSPWVVTMDALAPFRRSPAPREPDDPSPLPYLADAHDLRDGGIDMAVEVWLSTERMRAQGLPPVRLSRGNLADLFWTPAQFVAHHTSNGCNLRAGDLLGSGTVSGSDRDSRGCLLELTWRGTEPIALPGGETRRFLEDGDEVIVRGRCEKDGFAGLGFGECRGRILPAL